MSTGKGSDQAASSGAPTTMTTGVGSASTSGVAASATTATSKITKPYGKIVLTLRNELLPEDKLVVTPSEADGLDRETETDLRIYGCELIQTAGILLKLPQVAMATGQVLLQRFYFSKSLVRHPVDHTAMACVCLASKIEEAPRRVRDVINVFTHIRQVSCNKPITPVILDQPYIYLKNQVIKAERRVLKELGFCVHIKHPHKIIVMYLQVLGYENNQNLMQFSWNYMNDSLRTDAFVRHSPETIACACIYLTARKLRLPLPRRPAWYSLFGITEADIRDVCFRILRLYNRPKVNVDALEKKVDELCKIYQEAKLKARGGSAHENSTNNNSPGNDGAKTTGAHNAWGGFISRSGSHVPPPISSSNNTCGSATNNGNSDAAQKDGGEGRHHHRSRSKSGSRSPVALHHASSNNKHSSAVVGGGVKRSKKRSRTRSPPTRSAYKKASRTDTKSRRSSYSRSRSNSPKANRKRDKRRSSRSPSLERDRGRENNGKASAVDADRYIDRYGDRERAYVKDDERDRGKTSRHHNSHHHDSGATEKEDKYGGSRPEKERDSGRDDRYYDSSKYRSSSGRGAAKERGERKDHERSSGKESRRR